MPFRRVPPEVAFEVEIDDEMKPIYHVYKDGMIDNPLLYWYTTDVEGSEEDGECWFDIRCLSGYLPGERHSCIAQVNANELVWPESYGVTQIPSVNLGQLLDILGDRDAAKRAAAVVIRYEAMKRGGVTGPTASPEEIEAAIRDAHAEIDRHADG